MTKLDDCVQLITSRRVLRREVNEEKALLGGLEMKIYRDDEGNSMKECGLGCGERMQPSICTVPPQRNSRAATLRLSDISKSVPLPGRTAPSRVSHTDNGRSGTMGGIWAFPPRVSGSQELSGLLHLNSCDLVPVYPVDGDIAVRTCQYWALAFGDLFSMP